MQDIDVSVSGIAPKDSDSDAVVVFVPEKDYRAFSSFQELDAKMEKALSTILKAEHFGGKQGDTLVYHTSGRIRSGRVIVSGLGKKAKWTEEGFRRAAAMGALAARNAACSHVAFAVPTETGLTPEVLAAAIVEAAILATYKFIKFKTKQEESEPEKRLSSITLLMNSNSAVQKGIARAKLFAESTCFARDLVNEPANELNPEVLSGIAKKVARDNGLTFRVLEAPELKKMGAGAILGVGRGSKVPPRLIQLTYNSGKKKARKIALVGKGITFDSGGLSLKPSKYMETMKCDMAGARRFLPLCGRSRRSSRTTM